MSKLEDLCNELKITLETEYHGVKRDADGWDHVAWEVTVKRGSFEYKTPFRQGMAHGNEPTVVDVMACLMSDARSGELNTFEDFCSEFGYDQDSRKAEATYNACKATAKAMRRMLKRDFDTVADAASEH